MQKSDLRTGMSGAQFSKQNDDRLIQGDSDLSRIFPFSTIVLKGEKITVSDGVSDTEISNLCYQGEFAGLHPTVRESITLANFMRFFLSVNARQKYEILHIHRIDVMTLLTFQEIDSDYAVSIIYNYGNLAILVKLKSYNLLDIVNLIKNRNGLEIKMRGSYFFSDETLVSDLRKKNRLLSLSIDN